MESLLSRRAKGCDLAQGLENQINYEMALWNKGNWEEMGKQDVWFDLGGKPQESLSPHI